MPGDMRAAHDCSRASDDIGVPAVSELQATKKLLVMVQCQQHKAIAVRLIGFRCFSFRGLNDRRAAGDIKSYK